MKLLQHLFPTLCAALAFFSLAEAARKPSNAVLLANVKTLTLRKGAKTSARRVSAIPQLTCIGGNAKSHYEIDVLRCTNSGSDYDEANVQWTCKASLPPEFKLGSTDVICEGYDSPDDSYILKGSCGVEYRLVLTEAGEEKYGKKSSFSSWMGSDNSSDNEERGGLVGTVFWLLFIGVLLWMLYSMIRNWITRTGTNGQRRPQPWRPGGGTFWGGGGGDDDNDPPPPYTRRPPPKSEPAAQAQFGIRPGFWSGALGGAAAGYTAGRMGNNRQQAPAYGAAGGSNWFGGGRNAGFGGGRPSPSSFSTTSAPSTSRYESTGFGETRRR